MASGSQQKRFELRRRQALMQQSIGVYNQMVAERTDGWRDAIAPGLDVLEFVCCCGVRGCEETIAVPLPEYERWHAEPERLLVAPGHETQIDRVIERTPNYTVVEVREEFRMDTSP